MRLMLILPFATMSLAGCETNSDPAAGGFFNGLQGVTSGGYDARIDAREVAVAESRTRNEALQVEQSELAARIASSERALAAARFTLLNQRNASANLSPAVADRVNAVLAAQPTGNSEADRLASLTLLLEQTSALSQELAELGA